MFCTKCGKAIKQGDVFCGECGASVSTAPPPMAAAPSNSKAFAAVLAILY